MSVEPHEVCHCGHLRSYHIIGSELTYCDVGHVQCGCPAFAPSTEPQARGAAMISAALNLAHAFDEVWDDSSAMEGAYIDIEAWLEPEVFAAFAAWKRAVEQEYE